MVEGVTETISKSLPLVLRALSSSEYLPAPETPESDGETVVWSDQTPAADAKDPVITLLVSRADDQTALAEAELLLHVDGEGYLLGDDALSVN